MFTESWKNMFYAYSMYFQVQVKPKKNIFVWL